MSAPLSFALSPLLLSPARGRGRARGLRSAWDAPHLASPPAGQRHVIWSAFHGLEHFLAQCGGRIRDPDARGSHGVDLELGRVLTARDHGTRMAHAAARRGRPAMKPTTGFLVFDALMNSAPLTSASPPISPIMTMPWVSGSASNISRHSTKLVPFTGSPPMPMQVVWPRPTAVVCATAS